MVTIVEFETLSYPHEIVASVEGDEPLFVHC